MSPARALAPAFLTLFASAALASAAPGAAITLDAVRARWSELDSRTETLSASFHQTASMDDGPVQRTRGTLLYKKPGLLRVEQTEPEAQTIVSDGTWLWAYRPSAKQAIKSRLSSLSARKGGLPAAGFLEFGRLSRLLTDYDASISEAAKPERDGSRAFSVSLKPKKPRGAGADFVLELRASDRDFFPVEAVLRMGPTTVRSWFTNVRRDVPAPASDFAFSPPPGTDVFEDAP